MTFHLSIKIKVLILLLAVCCIAIPANAFPHSQKHSYSNRVSAEEVLHYINSFREHHGLSPLRMNSIISSEAEKHSRDMAGKWVPFGHSGFNNRARRLGRELSPVYATAENVAYGNVSAKKVVDMWIHSPGHRRNILGRYNLTGIGIASDRHGTLYFTQIFINKK